MKLKIIKPFEYDDLWNKIKQNGIANGLIFIKEGQKETGYSPEGFKILQSCKVKHLKDKTIKVTTEDELKKMSAKELLDLDD